jgi:hypothetical protein
MRKLIQIIATTITGVALLAGSAMPALATVEPDGGSEQPTSEPILAVPIWEA